jgi:large subunit ribosomal protein L16
MPKKGIIKYKRYHKGSIPCVTATRMLVCPDAPITQVIIREPIRITQRHLNSIKRTVRRLIKKVGRLYRVAVPFWPITSKPIQIRMGKGKGSVDYWAGRVKAGYAVVSFKKILKKISHKVLTVAATKVSGRTFVFSRPVLRYGRNDTL